jgi:hypothetical protein
MSSAPEKPSADGQGERHYFFICLAALLVLQLVLLARPLPRWTLSVRTFLPLLGLWPALLGGAGLMLRWRLAPVLVLLALAVLLFLAPSRSARDPVQGMLLGAAVLTFVVASYRLQSLRHFVFPRDPRQRALAGKPRAASGRKQEERGVPAPAALPDRRRPGRLVSLEELSFLLVTVMLWVGVAPFCYPFVESEPPPAGYETRWWERIGNQGLQSMASGLEGLVELIWQFRGGFWLLGGGVLVASLLLNHLLFRRQSPEEAALFLQDMVWKETRREQRRLNRWLAWARLRQEKRKERS